MYRGDKNHKPGSGPIGKPIDSTLSEAEKARIAADHVKQKINSKDSIFTSWSTSAIIARDKFAAGDSNRTTKVKRKEIEELEAQGQIKTYSPEQIGALMSSSTDQKLKKQANAVVQQMKRNREILVEGVIRASMQYPMK
jgi:hypothetical protein